MGLISCGDMMALIVNRLCYKFKKTLGSVLQERAEDGTNLHYSWGYENYLLDEF